MFSNSTHNDNNTPRKNTHSVIEQLDERRMMAVTGGAIGMVVNDGSTDFMNKAVPVLKAQGVTTVRLWHSVQFGKSSSKKIDGVLKRAIDYKNHGFDVMLVIQTKDGKATNASDVKDWFKWAMSNDSLKKAVDRWEIGNEPDHKQYWNGTLKSYVNDFLKPAGQVLRAAGEKVVSGAPSWNPQDVQAMINYGMLDYIDFVGYHPYASGVKLVKQRVQEINAVVAGRKPIIASEWNVRGFEKASRNDWAQAVKDAYPIIREGFAYNYYYALKVVDTPAGPAGIMHANGTFNTPFYNAFTTFKGGTSITPTVGNTPSTSKPVTSTPSSSNKTYSISGVLWNDSNGNGKWDSGETYTGSRIVYIDLNGNGKLDKGEPQTMSDARGRYTFTGLKAGTYKIGRVFPKGHKLSNGDGKNNYVTVKIGEGLVASSIHLGSRYA